MATNEASPSTMLFGRVKELAKLEALVERVEAGEPQYAAIEGPPGIGKTTLINHLIARTPTWRHLVVELDPSDEEVAGSAIKRILSALTGKRAQELPTSVEELVQHLLNVIYVTDGLTCLVIEDVQWIDQLSAEVMWRTARELDSGRSLVVVSYRPNTSTFTARLDRFLASGRHGDQITLGPLSVAEVQEVLRQRLRTPISARVARVVHEATNGTPLLLHTVANWLAAAPTNQRQLSTALAALDSMHDGNQRIFSKALLAAMDSLSPRERLVVSLLAAAGRPLRLALVQMIASEEGYGPVDISALEGSGLVVTKHDSTEVAIMHPQLAPLIAQQLPTLERVRLHRVLAAHTEGEIALGQRVQAQMLAPNPTELASLIGELEQAGTEALENHRPETAFRIFRWAMWFSDDARLLGLAVRAAMLADPPKLLPAIRTDLRRATASRTVSAATAYLHLNENDLPRALADLNRGLQLPESADDYAGTILLCHALDAAGRIAFTEGLFAAAAPAIDTALAQLEQARTALASADSTVQCLVPVTSEIVALEALLKLWSGFRHGDPRLTGDYITQMRAVYQELQSVPGTEAAADTVLSVLGAIIRQQGDLSQAYPMLQGALERQNVSHATAVVLACQLGMIAFQSAYWDEAQQLFTIAIEDSLLLPDDAGVAAAHAAAALVPLCRGEKEVGEALLDFAMSSTHHGDSVNDTIALARAMEATMSEDYESAVRFFSAIDEVPLGWAHVGHCYLALYARALVFTGRADLVPQLRRRLEAEAGSIPPALREAIHETLNAALSWVAGEMETTYHQLRRTVELLDTLPPVRPGAVTNPGGGHALFRALATMDIVELALKHHEVAEYRSEAVRLGKEAAAVFLRCGAAVLHEHCGSQVDMMIHGAEFVIADVPPPVNLDRDTAVSRERAYSRLNMLSSRERQISLEVAQGKSNREIATSLFLSVRTVEYHVANCLSKLNLASRVELRNALRPALEVRLLPTSGTSQIAS